MRAVLPDNTPGTLEIALDLGILEHEYAHVIQVLKRTPTFAELGVFSAMFSEHCSYKSSKRFLRRFPTKGPAVLQGPGENAGVVDIGDGWGVAFKMESHNHPSFIEPFQGAATGVGGILRDVFTMGARPIASMDCLYFGSPDYERTSEIVRGVVRGVGHYGNCVGVPTVAGQTFFHPSYTLNPLVNAFTLGIIRTDSIFLGSASGIGNLVVYVGAKTGRDGVHGATMASQEFSTEAELERPTVQVGDPFTEKLLLEATLEAMRAGLIVGIQDMGAAGLTSSSFEMAGRAGTSLTINLDKIPARETGMTAYELLLSESQERMLLVCKPVQVAGLFEIFGKWDLHADVIGEVIATPSGQDNRVQMSRHGKCVVDLPVSSVADPMLIDRAVAPPADLEKRWEMSALGTVSGTLQERILRHLSDLNFASPAPITEQYDSMVGNRTLTDVGSDSAVMGLRDLYPAGSVDAGFSGKRLVLSADCNPRVCWLWPLEGGRRTVAEAALNIACQGGKPLAITDCLNFGSPENPEVMWQFEQCIEGISLACRALETPVVSGNVSFYNDTDGTPILPTPSVGMVGLIEKSSGVITRRNHGLWDSAETLELGLIGEPQASLGGSAYAYNMVGRDVGKPSETKMEEVSKTIALCRDLSTSGEYGLHDVSDGGLLVAVLEMLWAAKSNIGLRLALPQRWNVDQVLFGESLPRVCVAYPTSHRASIMSKCFSARLPFHPIGRTQLQHRLTITSGEAAVAELDLERLVQMWRQKWRSMFGSKKRS